MASLQGQSVLITGASRGIGAAMAETLAEAGCALILAARDEEALQRLSQRLQRQYGVPVVYRSVDLSIEGEIQKLVAFGIEHYARIDILINNAGVGLMGEVAEMDRIQLHYIFEVNFYAALSAIQAVVPSMRRQGGGVIVNVSSIVSFFPQPLGSGYSATKYALNAIGEAAAVELSQDGIDVVQVFPGVTQTEFFRHSRSSYSGFQGERQPMMPGVSPRKVALRIRRAIERREPYVFVTFTDWLFVMAARLVPRTFRTGLGLLTVVRRRRYPRGEDEPSQRRSRTKSTRGHPMAMWAVGFVGVLLLLVRFRRKGKG